MQAVGWGRSILATVDGNRPLRSLQHSYQSYHVCWEAFSSVLLMLLIWCRRATFAFRMETISVPDVRFFMKGSIVLMQWCSAYNHAGVLRCSPGHEHVLYLVMRCE
jgi:hypothetical protein